MSDSSLRIVLHSLCLACQSCTARVVRGQQQCVCKGAHAFSGPTTCACQHPGWHQFIPSKSLPRKQTGIKLLFCHTKRQKFTRSASEVPPTSARALRQDGVEKHANRIQLHLKNHKYNKIIGMHVKIHFHMLRHAATTHRCVTHDSTSNKFGITLHPVTPQVCPT